MKCVLIYLANCVNYKTNHLYFIEIYKKNTGALYVDYSKVLIDKSTRINYGYSSM